MSPKPFDLDAALAELRADAPSPEARVRARLALNRPGARPAWRLAAVTGALALLLLPAALRTRGSEASALTLDQAVAASKAAPYVVQRLYDVDARGRRSLAYEALWGPQRRVERHFFQDGYPGRETRRLPGLVFERHLVHTRPGMWRSTPGFRSYETVRRAKPTDEPVRGTDDLAVFRIVSNHERGVLAGLRPVRTDARFAWFRPTPDSLWKVELATRRVVSTQVRNGDGFQANEIAYPSRLGEEQLGVPPLGDLPRFDLDAERREMDRLNAVGERTKDGVKLVGVFQEVCAPGRPVYVAYEGAGLARAKGLSRGGITTLKSIPPKVVATVFRTNGPMRTLDVEIPSARGFVRFENVRVRPVSVEIRSGLRTPPFE